MIYFFLKTFTSNLNETERKRREIYKYRHTRTIDKDI